MANTADIDLTQSQIDARKKEEEEDPRPPLPAERAAWSVYLKPYWLTILMNHNKIIYGLNLNVVHLASTT